MSLLLHFLLAFAMIPARGQINPPPGVPSPSDKQMVHRLLIRWNTSKEYTIQIAEQMPDRGYNCCPRPADLTFGKELLEVTNYTLSIAEGLSDEVLRQKEAIIVERRGGFDASKDKKTMISILELGFAVGAQAIGSLTDTDLMCTGSSIHRVEV
jgi:hypothetical protein